MHPLQHPLGYPRLEQLPLQDRRWDGWRRYRADPTLDAALERTARVWDAPDGSLAGVAHADGDGQLAIQVDPAHRHLEPEMLAWAEGTLAAPDGAGGRRLVTPVRDYDHRRGRLLVTRGWRPTDDWGVTCWQRLGAEPVNRLAIVEPVCTHPDHRRRGLAESLIRAGLERGRQAGPTQACVDTGSGEAANHVVADAGFGEVFVERAWEWRGPTA